MMAVTYKRKTFHVAEAWNELTGRQVQELMKVLHGKKIEPVKLQLWIWKIISSLKWWQYLVLPNNFLLNTLDFVDFVFQENKLTKQFFPKIKHLYGPADNFDNLKVSEFVFSELYYMEWVDSKNSPKGDEALNKLVAVLYRPIAEGYNERKNEAGDKRAAFNENLISGRAKTIARWPKDIKLAIATWYAGCKKALIEDNQTVFGGGKKSSSNEGGINSLLSIMRSVAKDGIYGDFDKVEQLYIKTLMMELRERIKDVEEENRRMAK